MDKKDLIIELSLLLMDVEEEVIMDMINQVTGDEDRIVFIPDVLH
tara:strand:- start:2172 stop:2306 length:135 start_codon:yes stop_codon:yes gene_type:complete